MNIELELLLLKVNVERLRLKLPSLASARLFFFESESSSPKCTYMDKECDIPSTNPVIADGSGNFPEIFLDHGLYRVVLQDAFSEDLVHKDYLNE